MISVSMPIRVIKIDNIHGGYAQIREGQMIVEYIIPLLRNESVAVTEIRCDLPERKAQHPIGVSLVIKLLVRIAHHINKNHGLG